MRRLTESQTTNSFGKKKLSFLFRETFNETLGKRVMQRLIINASWSIMRTGLGSEGTQTSNLNYTTIELDTLLRTMHIKI
jgi:hypothetical protein